ncbi:MAG: LPXTG cell wall anchor domain-containing protein [Oscillospiraceae bacterium]|nr:LPXTG cell wall anchor domain-containing protein [Oscillospiraceae bacterium]
MSAILNNRIGRLWAILLLLLLLLQGTGHALAAESVELELPLLQNVSGPGAEQAVIQYRLKANRTDCPMPSGSEKGVYAFTLTGTVKGTLPAIRFDSAGEWSYTLSCSGAADPRVELESSPASYELKIAVMESADGLIGTAVAIDKDGNKCDLQFAHTIRPPEISKAPKTGDENRPLLYIGLLALSLAAVVAAILLLRKKKRR